MSEFRRALFAGAPLLSREWFAQNAWVVAGSLVMAAGYHFFIIPHHVVPGGIIGLAQLINQLTGWPVGLTALVINVPILILASRILGPGFGAKTVLSMVLGSLAIDGLAAWHGADTLIPDILVSTVFGGVMIGVGVAMIIRGKANAGGTSLVGQLLSRLTRVPTGRCMLWVDGLIVVASMVVLRDLKAAPYAVIGIYVISRSLDAFLNGLDASKALMIISDRHEEIRRVILQGLDRGGTVLSGHGLFSQDQERKVIFTALSRRETVALQKQIERLDPHAFCMVFDTAEVLGSGFKPWR
ncbi:MAG: YitT family protein [Candidatus Krumholzibacteriia bacterium]